MLEVERNARLVAYYPSVMSWPHFECFSRAHRDLSAISPSNRHPSRENISDVGQRGLARLSAYMQRPPPPRTVFSTSNRHRLQNHGGSFASVEERPRLVSAIEASCQGFHELIVPHSIGPLGGYPSRAPRSRRGSACRWTQASALAAQSATTGARYRPARRPEGPMLSYRSARPEAPPASERSASRRRPFSVRSPKPVSR